MYAVITGAEYKEIVRSAIGVNNTIIFESYGVAEIKMVLSELSRLRINCLILQSCVAEANKLIEAIKGLKVIRPYIRIIFISPDSRPGDPLIASLIAKGVYDIFCPSSQDTKRKIAEDLQRIIARDPANYGDVVRWDVSNTRVSNNRVAAMPVTIALVVNTSKCAGSTFVATSLAGIISKHKIIPAVIEIPTEPYLFDSLGLTLLEHNGNKFYSYPHEIINQNYPDIGKESVADSIVWLVPDSRLAPITEWGYAEMLRLLYCCKQAGVIIVDAGSNIDKECIQSLIPIVDIVIAIIDPLPVHIIKAQDNIRRISEFKKKGAKVIYVANRWVPGLSKADFIKLSNVKPSIYLPAIDLTSIYKAAYSCHIPYSIHNVQNILDKEMFNIVKELLPASIIKMATKSKGLFSKKERW